MANSDNSSSYQTLAAGVYHEVAAVMAITSERRGRHHGKFNNWHFPPFTVLISNAADSVVAGFESGTCDGEERLI